MKDYLREQLIRPLPGDQPRAIHVCREYLQARILASLQGAGAMLSLAFHGGTCLRFLYALGRFSEDLDFTLERAREDYDFRRYLRAVQRDLSAEGYGVELKVSDQRTVNSAFVRFPGLLYELGLSARRQQILSIKVEVDTNPPMGATLETTVIRRYVAVGLHHHDASSLLAGKLHALLQRPYVKGRDFYDLFWYLSQRAPTWPPPNLEQLSAALSQSGWQGPPVDRDNWRQLVAERLSETDWDRVIADVEPFIEHADELPYLAEAPLRRLLLPDE